MNRPEDFDRVIREAVRKSKDGRIDQSDFLNYAAATSRYNLFTPMEANIIFHFAGRGIPSQRLALLDFAQFLNPRWRAPGDLDGVGKAQPSTGSDFLTGLAKSAYSFVQGGFAGAFGATIVYPIDLGVSYLFSSRDVTHNSGLQSKHGPLCGVRNYRC